MRPYVLADTNWKHLKDFKYDLAILPWGATEAHNYHLPYSTDVIEGTAVAEESGKIAWEKGAKVVILPTIPFGVNTGQSDIYLDVNLNPSTQFAILKDVITVLDRQGIRKFMILNSHGGNNWKSIVRELGLLFPKMFLCVGEWVKTVDRTKYFDDPGDHADEMETSLILHLAPDLVLDKKEWGDGNEKKNKIEAFTQGWAWSERPWSKISEDTGVGNPQASTKAKGERFFNAICEKMGQLFVEIAEADTDNLYE
ncbi:creatininase family protein [Spongiivirga citrea]|uniref:Creatininase family protein n=1 Tax=Spongiivirga citrea TaxID=1481457 RepID=A0A6M0CJ51_9FLAO|nr:creatininase family protein [Spongiivirga citrea]